MPRVRRGFKARRRRNRVFKKAKGFFGSRGRLFRVTCVAVMHALKDAYVGRKLRKRDMRRLWITRISAAARAQGISYSVLMGGLCGAGSKDSCGLGRVGSQWIFRSSKSRNRGEVGVASRSIPSYSCLLHRTFFVEQKRWSRMKLFLS